MIDRLRKRELMLIRWRWPLALVHASVVIASFVLMVILAKFPDDIPNVKPLLVSSVMPQLILLMAFSIGWLGYLIINWRGNATTHLLLKLIDGQKNGGKAPSSNERPPSP